MHETDRRTAQHSLPHNFHISPHHPSPSHTPSLSSRPFSPALCSSPVTPLASYVVQRQQGRALPVEASYYRPQVSLSTLSPTSMSGAVGGSFNSTTKIKLVPLPTLYLPHQSGHRGVRSVRLHTDRYLPSSSLPQQCKTLSDSLLHLPSLDSRPKARLLGQEDALQRMREFKRKSVVLPHRVEQPFYMRGCRARIVGRDEVPESELDGLRRVRFAENQSLYYGQGLVQPATTSCGAREAVRRFEVRLNTALERSYRLGQGVTLPAAAVVENTKKTVDDCKHQAFLTEPRNRPDV